MVITVENNYLGTILVEVGLENMGLELNEEPCILALSAQSLVLV
jgi:hypothetical protein